MVSVLAAQRVRAIKTEGGRKNLENQYAIEMLNITKKFPGIIANDNITLQLKKGEIHALLGENGAGKSTLMSVLFGLYQPEEGIIKKDGEARQHHPRRGDDEVRLFAEERGAQKGRGDLKALRPERRP